MPVIAPQSLGEFVTNRSHYRLDYEKLQMVMEKLCGGRHGSADSVFHLANHHGQFDPSGLTTTHRVGLGKNFSPLYCLEPQRSLAKRIQQNLCNGGGIRTRGLVVTKLAPYHRVSQKHLTTVVTVSMMSAKKNSTAHNGATGNLAMASE